MTLPAVHRESYLEPSNYDGPLTLIYKHCPRTRIWFRYHGKAQVSCDLGGYWLSETRYMAITIELPRVARARLIWLDSGHRPYDSLVIMIGNSGS